MRYYWLLSIVSMLIPWTTTAHGSTGHQVRKLFLKPDEIAEVRTAVGIATIIQVPDRPTSVVLGDTNAFRVEYLDTAITIKPLNFSSKSNLYIYTEARRFNVSLLTSSQANADFIVYLKSEKPIAPPLKEQWRKFETERNNGNLKLTVRRLGLVGNHLLIEFSLSAKKDMTFSPEWIWLTQKGKTVPINGLNLSGTKLTSKNQINGGVVIRKEDVTNPAAFAFELRADSPITIKLPGVSAWMK